MTPYINEQMRQFGPLVVALLALGRYCFCFLVLWWNCGVDKHISGSHISVAIHVVWPALHKTPRGPRRSLQSLGSIALEPKPPFIARETVFRFSEGTPWEIGPWNVAWDMEALRCVRQKAYPCISESAFSSPMGKNSVIVVGDHR